MSTRISASVDNHPACNFCNASKYKEKIVFLQSIYIGIIVIKSKETRVETNKMCI